MFWKCGFEIVQRQSPEKINRLAFWWVVLAKFSLPFHCVTAIRFSFEGGRERECVYGSSLKHSSEKP